MVRWIGEEVAGAGREGCREEGIGGGVGGDGSCGGVETSAPYG